MDDSVDCYYGLYRGIIRETKDPEKRFRYRVAVMSIHDETFPVEHLPWAETGFAFSASKAKMSSDIPHFEVNDVVWVMFEGGDRRFPVITGGWITHSIGINDVPAEQAEDYDRTRRRWQRIDRTGNLIEVSEVGDELHVKLQSGGAQLILSQKDNSIVLKCVEGVVRVEAPKAEIVSKQAVVDSNEVTILGARDEDDLADDVRGRAHLLAHMETNVHALNPNDANEGEVNVGGYTPKQKGDIVQSAPPLQTPLTNIRAKVIRMGVRENTTDGMHTRPVTTQVEIHGVDYVKIDSPALVDLRVTEDDATINVVNEGDGDINVKGEGGGDINIESTDAKVNIKGSTEINVKAEDAGGKLNEFGQTLVEIKSDVKVKIDAPSIEIG